MIPQQTSKEEMDDLEKRQVLQTKLQEATRRSAAPSEIRRIQEEIQEHNRKLEAYASRQRKQI